MRFGGELRHVRASFRSDCRCRGFIDSWNGLNQGFLLLKRDRALMDLPSYFLNLEKNLGGLSSGPLAMLTSITDLCTSIPQQLSSIGCISYLLEASGVTARK